ncbi:Long-chain-fatty-acid--CoA ligase [Thraustotheca clavata]|uniref:Long-chain-fatty-acid--CoA ligase n=1 Tax=Thraustotheca clavata TaxID=74557 RepID=A0A1V9ZPS7_9STRA|nr:Long-chain-fatty-acid--CoA ligase [Thraustotheca clavata]
MLLFVTLLTDSKLAQIPIVSMIATPKDGVVPAVVTLAVGGFLYHQLSSTPIARPQQFSTIDHSQATAQNGAVYQDLKGLDNAPNFTLRDKLVQTVKEFPEKPFLGHRPIDADGNAGPYTWQTYGQCYERIECIASGLAHEKMLEPTADGNTFLCIYMKNRPEWVLAQYSAYYLGGTIVPIYDTLGPNATSFILNQTLASTIVCTTAEVNNVLSKAKAVPTLKNIVLCDVSVINNELQTKASELGIKLSTILDIEATGRQNKQEAVDISPSSVAILMYTSGTTGNPKGALLTHANINAVRIANHARVEIGEALEMLNKHPTTLSYLPLAHIAEQTLQASLIHKAGGIGFYQGDPLKILDDIQALRPTIFASVPRLLNRIYDKVMEAALSAGGFKTWLFMKALTTKVSNLQSGYPTHALYDRLVFSKLRAKLGLDQCKLFFVGAAPLSPAVLSFFRVMLNCMCLEIYGQTEACGCVTMTDHRDLIAGTVGSPLASAELKLVSVPDMGYNVTDTVHGEGNQAIAVCGRGEVCIRGPSLFLGYFKKPEMTAEVMDKDGWVHSGDIGVWTTDGRLKIVDRKKNLFKLSQGEYVAPEKVENVIQSSTLVAAAFVYGDSLRSSLVAVIVPDESAITNLAATLNLSGTIADWCKSPKINERILQDIVRVSKAEGLFGFETVRAIHLEPVPFSVDNGLTTPTFKLKRHAATKIYAGEIDLLVDCFIINSHRLLLLALTNIHPLIILKQTQKVDLDLNGLIESPKITLMDQLQKAVREFPEKPFLGHRPVDANGDAGPYIWQTYAQCYERIQNIASGLAHEKMLEPTVDGNNTIIVPIYDTLGSNATAFILNQTLTSTIVCTTAEVKNLLEKATGVPTLKNIVLCDVSVINNELQTKASIKLSTILEIELTGRQHKQEEVNISPNSIALLMYTSGTTGNPKGVLLTHNNVSAVPIANHSRLVIKEGYCVLNHHPIVISYLPLAHVAEQVLHVSTINKAGAIGFYQGDPLKIIDDIRALRPTFLSVPRLLNRIYDKVIEAELAAGGYQARLFTTALNTKIKNLKDGNTTHDLYDQLVFSKIRAKLGLDRCEVFYTGAAPLSPAVLSFFRVMLNCLCIESYGQTEACGAITMTDHRE